MNKNYKLILRILRSNWLKHLSFIFLLTIFSVQGQLMAQSSITVTGKVASEETGEPLPGVNIIQKGTTNGTSTDAAGRYSLLISEGDAVLVFSFIGYTTQELAVNGRSAIDVILSEDVQSLDEVVVVGYGTQRKVTLTGSVATASATELQATPATNLTNSLSGLLPGLITLNRTGQPGNTSELLIRGRNTTGNNSPLIVVDGVQDASFQWINSNDIESISVLKDASAAIYGARAANGVILITTKRGTVGKPIISYTFNQGMSRPTRLPDFADSYTYAQYSNELLLKAGQPIRYTDAELQKFKDGSDPLNYPNTDWLSILDDYSLQSQHNMNVRGGSEFIKYSISGSHTNENSIYKDGSLNYKTYAIRGNTDAQINQYLKVGFDLTAHFQNSNSPPYNVFDHIYVPPYQPIYWPNGFPSSGITYGLNPAIVASSQSGNVYSGAQQYMAKGSFNLVVPWVKGLGVDGYAAFTNNITAGKTFLKTWIVNDYNKLTDTYIPVKGGIVNAPQLTESYARSTGTLLNLKVKYEKQFNDHRINAFIALEQFEGYSHGFSAFRRDFATQAIDELFAGSLINQSTNGNSSESGRKNYFGRFNYGFKDKYLLDFTARYDGSSAFPKGKQFGFFPGASFAWRVSEENFIKNNVRFIDDLKLRASYANMGNDAIAAFQYLRLYTLGNTGYNYGQTPALSQGLTMGVTPNPNITWEVAKVMNIGLDAQFLNGLIGFEVDVFEQRRSNILATRDLALPAYTGLALPQENIGIVENQGLELKLTHRKSIREFSWRVEGNVAYNHSKIIEISEPQNVPAYQKAEGHSIGAGLYYLNNGIARTQAQVDAAPTIANMTVGHLMYKDVNNDGKIDPADRVRLDNSNIPQVTFGLNLSVNYKNFSLWSNFTGQTKAWQFFIGYSDIGYNALQDLISNRYTPESMDSKYPIIPTKNDNAQISGLRSDFWLWDASFLRLKTLSLSYSVPESLTSKLKINSMRVYLNGNNLFTIDKIKLFDPEGSDEYGDRIYPQAKIYNLGINLTF